MSYATCRGCGIALSLIADGEGAFYIDAMKHSEADCLASRLDSLRPLLDEIWRAHRNPSANDYNECEIGECAWCAETKAAFVVERQRNSGPEPCFNEWHMTEPTEKTGRPCPGCGIRLQPQTPIILPPE